MWSQNPSFRLKIENFWKKKDEILSKVFVAGGCEWFLKVYPKGDQLSDDDHMSMYLSVANPKSLRIGWKRNVSFYFIVSNHRNFERRSHIIQSKLFDTEAPAWGSRNLFPLSQLKKKSFMGKDSLIIDVYINVIEAVNGESDDVSEKETLDINGFQVSASQVALVKKIFAEHPDIALGFKPKNQVVKTTYMNVLLDLINTLDKPSGSHSEAELLISHGKLSELEELGFRIDWLKSKLDRKKDDADGSRVQQLEERVKNLEQMEEKMDSFKREIGEVILEREKAKADEPQVKKLEERLKNLEMMEGFRMDCLKSKLEEFSLEKKKSDDVDGSRIQQLEESVKNLAMTVSDLKAKLDEEKAKSSCGDFLLL